MGEIKNIEEDSFLAKWLEGAISDQELQNLVSKEDFISYKNIKNGLHVLDELNKSTNTSFDIINSRIDQNKKAKKSTGNYKWVLSIAASFLVLLGILFVFDSQEVSIETSYAEQKEFSLPDGSEVVLNAKSEISYNENDWETNRIINLKGEAYFKVKKGSSFTVNALSGKVEVLGTQFNVNNSGQYFDVVCYEGRVKVTNNKKEFILNPGNSVRKINGNDTEEYNSNKQFPSWTKGESSFVSVPIKYVILELEKQYNIEIDNSKIDDSKIFTGSFSHNNLKIALASVFNTMNIKYMKEENGILRLE